MTVVRQNILSVMVVALNEARNLPRLLAALADLELPPTWSFETILVDGGSTDGTHDVARELGVGTLLSLPGASIPVCRNAALQAARGTALAFLDGDCLPAPDWLAVAAPHLLSPVPTLLGFPVRPPASGNWIQRAWHAHWQHKNNAAQNAALAPFDRDAFRLITTRNMLFNRALLQVVPRFDEQLVTGEDTDFAFRATEAGAHVLALPTLVVTHLGEPATLQDYYRQQLWHANRRAYATILKSSGGKRGANAIYFTLAFLGCLFLAVAGLLAALIFLSWWPLLLLLPLLLVTAAPALLIALRARSALLIPRLSVLYFLYGLARSIDFLGLAPEKPSWKSSR